MRKDATGLTIDEILLTRVRVFFYGLSRENCHAVAQAGVVAIDPSSRCPGAKNLLHELIHVRRPLWAETKVRQWEGKLWRSSTWRQKAELYKMLARGRVWGGEEVIGEQHDLNETPPKPVFPNSE